MSLYDLDPDRFGRFKIVFCFGLLYHLRYPLLGLDRIAALADEVIIETAILDDFSAYKGDIGKGYGGEDMRETRGDFDAAGVEQSDHQIRRTMEELLAEAIEQVKNA